MDRRIDQNLKPISYVCEYSSNLYYQKLQNGPLKAGYALCD